jgi:hypothetical protein
LELLCSRTRVAERAVAPKRVVGIQHFLSEPTPQAVLQAGAVRRFEQEAPGILIGALGGRVATRRTGRCAQF